MQACGPCAVRPRMTSGEGRGRGRHGAPAGAPLVTCRSSRRRGECGQQHGAPAGAPLVTARRQSGTARRPAAGRAGGRASRHSPCSRHATARVMPCVVPHLNGFVAQAGLPTAPCPAGMRDIRGISTAPSSTCPRRGRDTPGPAGALSIRDGPSRALPSRGQPPGAECRGVRRRGTRRSHDLNENGAQATA